MPADNDPLFKSCLVVAHPDDELLWFSSILEEVDRIIVCFGDSPSMPRLTRGRANVVRDHPCKNLDTLAITEAGVFDCANWPVPDITSYGLHIRGRKNRALGEQYRANYSVLVTQLKDVLSEYQNIYTHNSWGEYGHEEHVQVHRAVDACRRELGFNMWCSGYFGSRSHSLMVQETRRLTGKYFSRTTNRELQRRLYALYDSESAWTWLTDMSDWLDAESMFLVDSDHDMNAHARYLPMNFIDMERPHPSWMDRSLRSLGKSILRRFLPG